MGNFLGRGWAYPIALDATGRVAMAEREQGIEQAIALILGTSKGQRVLRPDFGCQIHDLSFAPNDATTAGLAVYYVEQALGMWEPRIRLLDVSVQTDIQTSERLLITIQYEIKATHDRRSLVYPFYHIPEE